MPTESVEILINAEDLASQKFADASKNIEANVKRVKVAGEQTKKSLEFGGAIANAFGGTEIGRFASQLGQLTEKTSQFAEVQKLGGAGALAFKAGLVASVGAISFGIGKAIGDLIFQTGKLTREFESATAAAKELAAVNLGKQSKSIDNAGQDIELIRDPEEKRQKYEELLQSLNVEIQGTSRNVNQGKKAVEEYADSWGAMVGYNKAIAELEKSSLAEDQARLKMLKEKRDAINEILSARTADNEALKKSNAEAEKSESYLQGLRDEVELLKASNFEKTELAASKNTNTTGAKDEAVSLINEAEELKMATKIQEMKDKELEKLEQERILLTEGAEAARAFALVKQGMSEADAKDIASKEAGLAALKAEQDEAKKLAAIKQNELDKLEERAILLEQGKEAAREHQLKKQGLDDETIKGITKEEARLDAIEKSEEKKPGLKASEPRPDLQATQSRLKTSGSASQSGIDKLAAEAKQATKQRDAQTKQLVALNKKLAEKGLKIVKVDA